MLVVSFKFLFKKLIHPWPFPWCLVLFFSLNMCWVIWREGWVTSLRKGALGWPAAWNLRGSQSLLGGGRSCLACPFASCLWASGPSSHSPILLLEWHYHVADPTRWLFCINWLQTPQALLERVHMSWSGIPMAPVCPQTSPLLGLPWAFALNTSPSFSEGSGSSPWLCPECTYFPSPSGEPVVGILKTLFKYHIFWGTAPTPIPRRDSKSLFYSFLLICSDTQWCL